MTISIYDVCIPALTRGLANMSVFLDKGGAYAEARKFDTLVFSQARLFPDMHPLARQVQIACDTTKGAAARLAGLNIDGIRIANFVICGLSGGIGGVDQPADHAGAVADRVQFLEPDCHRPALAKPFGIAWAGACWACRGCRRGNRPRIVVRADAAGRGCG